MYKYCVKHIKVFNFAKSKKFLKMCNALLELLSNLFLNYITPLTHKCMKRILKYIFSSLLLICSLMALIFYSYNKNWNLEKYIAGKK